MENPSHDCRLFRIDHQFPVFVFIISHEAGCVDDRLPVFKPFAHRPPVVLACTAGFLLRKGCKDRQHQLTLMGKCVDILLLKQNTDTKFLQLTDVLQDGDGISCESRYGLCQNQINAMLSCILKHVLKCRPMLTVAGNALIGVNAHELIFRI